MPKQIIKTYKILNVPRQDFVHEALDIIGVPRENRIPLLRVNELAFCKIVIYPFNPMIHQSSQGFPQKMIQDLYHKHYNLDGINATRNCIINRRDTRVWFNSKKLLAALKENYPQLEWEIVADIHGLKESAKVYASIKFLMTPSGSNLFHCFFMHRGGVILTVEGNQHDWSSVLSILACGIHHIIFQSPKLNHVAEFPGFNVDVGNFVKAAGFAVKYLTKGEFPKEELDF
ncbi:hypothetical protein TVAG_452310 [Trichomonas vaginalis G3]|uniref:Glycosyltransferase 61 catalytic domain-containing protein n=1 Tax=Trichomonas vaginalis (strain ATCC PRA-98 / G3) TaxID=412133 RepID=A2DJV3_TRIV3|nr:glycosyltransferase family [Trichomonas vaginalis G3]EAY19317.1 hypothetical protein TVAG_452310 [Trichomonas vaginalis G3]KAI5527217.1 glycosyltransferase family [Trichomonas vaginalis G3]|eukprot:XP_001580303.1 hypothetical protein [Trichomonas vaginalis G3]